MSQENVELAARFYGLATTKAEILAAIPRMMNLCHPEIEWIAPEGGASYRGREGVRRRLEEWLESFDEYRWEVQRITDCGGGEVLVEATDVGRGAKSGVEVYEYLDDEPYVICDARWYATGQQSQMPVDVRQVDVYEVRDGRIIGITLGYTTKSEALEAVGLRE